VHSESDSGSRVAVVDIGTNSTRLLIADVRDGAIEELDRRSEVARLGEGVDSTGRLGDEPIARVVGTLEGFVGAIREKGAERTVAVATSAVRDAENGDEFRALLRERFDLDAQTISGEEEARLTFLGATLGRGDGDDPVLVIDIGGGSTEFVIGSPARPPSFHVSSRAGSVRQTERHLADDPPPQEQLAALGTEVREIVERDVSAGVRAEVSAGIAVAGTATSLAAIDQELDPFDPAKVHGYRLDAAACERMLGMLAARSEEERREVAGLDPARAPTIVAGAAILLESMRGFGLEEVEVSEADLLHGAALTSFRAVS
jgi:exopolyphosphatase / guanosine-5'-triphosphate,3'-diphosphate pyrophosphatase